MGNIFQTLRKGNGLKLLVGMRGTKKSSQLLAFQDILLSEGVPQSHILYVDAESPAVRRYKTPDQFIDFIKSALPADGVSHVLIREAAALPDVEVSLGVLLASLRYVVYATSSSRQILTNGLGKYLSASVQSAELPPPELETSTEESLHALWNNIFLNDVVFLQRVQEVRVASSVADYLSDNLGDPISLRQVAAAVSPGGRAVSPHTIASCLDALNDAFIVEKVLRFDIAEEAPQATRYRYFFTSIALRNARFGASPQRDPERVRLNEAWLSLRRNYKEVFVASGSKKVDFVTRHNGALTYWHLDESGLATVERNTFVAG